MRTWILLLALSAFSSSASDAELSNATMRSSDSSASLQEIIERQAGRSDEASWLGYQVPRVASEYEICCGRYGTSSKCRLDQRGWGMSLQHRRGFSSGDEIQVYLRLRGGSVDRVRVFSEGCRVDADGQTIHWIENLDVQESAQTLISLTEAGTDVSDAAMAALALHDTPIADVTLEKIASKHKNGDLRGEAVFWLGNLRDQAGFEALERLLAQGADSELREEIAFALSESPVPEAFDALIEMGRSDPDPEVRGVAIFWLAQEGGERAEAAIMRALANDSSEDVREEAVFALSELPGDRGTELLAAVARDRSMPKSARQEAIFWLGQSDDDHAMELIEAMFRD